MATLNNRLAALEQAAQIDTVPTTIQVVFHGTDGSKRDGPSFTIQLPRQRAQPQGNYGDKAK